MVRPWYNIPGAPLFDPLPPEYAHAPSGCRFLDCRAYAGAAVAAQAPDDPDLQKTLALQKTLQKVVAQVEPSVACILVSRSDAYRTLGLGPDKDHPGRLGDFDPEVLRSKPSASLEILSNIRRRAIGAHDLQRSKAT